MTTIIKNQIVKQLARFTKNLSPSKISLKFLKGEGELRNLELNENFLTDLLELPPFIRLTKAVCNKISAKIHWTRLKTDPIRLFLDCVEVEMIMTENVTDPEVNQLNSKQSIPSNQTTREKPSEYGFVEKVVDGMLVTINSVIMAFKTSTFRATFQMSHLSIHSTNPNWEKATLRSTRIKDEAGKEVLTFKQITFGTLRVDADALYKCGEEEDSTSSPLRLITSSAKINIVIKKKIEDCSVISARLCVILDDILWVLTHAQLQAVASFAKSVVQVVEKSKKCEPAPSVASDDSSYSSNVNADSADGQQLPAGNPGQNPTSLFRREDVKETSYRVSTGKIDIHLCDDGNGQSNGGSMQIIVNNLYLEHYPYHLAFTSRVHWASHNDASLKRAHWVQELFNSYKKVMKEDEKKRRHSPSGQKSHINVHSKQSNYVQESGGTGKVTMVTQSGVKKRCRQYLYECAFVISCNEFIVMPVATNDKMSSVTTPFLCSDKKSLHLPSDMPALQFDYTLYFYPGQEDAKVPQPNLFCQLNPLHLTMDDVTCIWFNKFMQSIRLGFMWAEELIAVQGSEPRHIDVRIEGLMPKLTLPCPSDTSAYYKQFRPQALQIHLSSFQASNTRVGKEFKQCDLVNTLEAFVQAELYTRNKMFPNDGRDVKPLSQVAWLNDFSVCSGVETIERFLNDVKEDYSKMATSVVWMLNAKQCWCDFIGVDEANSRPRPFVEPFPLRLCMCYPVAFATHPPPPSVQYQAETKSTTEESKRHVSSLHRTPSDPYSAQPRVYGRNSASSTRSTPVSPGFARIHKSRSATSVNIPVLASDVEKVQASSTYLNLTSSLNASRSTSEDGSGDSYFEDTGSGSAQSIPSTSDASIITGMVASSDNQNANTISNSTGGTESDGSAEHGYERNNGVLPITKPESKCRLSLLLYIPSIVCVKLDHFQFVFLMRLQENFVSLSDTLSADFEKFEIQRNKLQEKDLVSPDEPRSQDRGIVVSLVSRGAQVSLLVPAPTGEQQDTPAETEPVEESCDDKNKSENDHLLPNVARPSEELDRGSETTAVHQTKESGYGNDHRVSIDVGTVITAEVGDWTIVDEQRSRRTSMDPAEKRADESRHERSPSNCSSGNASTNGSEFSLQTGGSMASEKSFDTSRSVSTVTIHGNSLECSVAINDDDFAFKLVASGCELREGFHKNLEVFLGQKIKKPSKEIPRDALKSGQISLRYAMGSTVDQSLDGAVEKGVAHLSLNNVIATILMSNLDGLLECVQDEIAFPPPFMPVIIDLEDFNIAVNSDTPPRLLSIPPSLPLNVHIDQGTITRTAEGNFDIKVHSTPSVATSCEHHPSKELLEKSKEIEILKVESNNMASRMASVRNKNLRLLKELEISKEAKESVENERDRLLVTIERLTEELIRSNREQDELQKTLRLSHKT